METESVYLTDLIGIDLLDEEIYNQLTHEEIYVHLYILV